MKEIKTEMTIPAKPGEIWDILTDAASHTEWNPQIVRIRGRLTGEEKIHVRVHAPVGSGMAFGFKAKMVGFEPYKRLAWEGGVPGILFGHHYWELQDLGTETKVIHGEKFKGLFAFFLTPARIEQLGTSYAAANLELKKHIVDSGM